MRDHCGVAFVRIFERVPTTTLADHWYPKKIPATRLCRQQQPPVVWLGQHQFGFLFRSVAVSYKECLVVPFKLL